jgi:hypothetical protein
MTDWLRRNLIETFKLPLPAVEWLCQLFDVIQTFDDLVDNDRLVQKNEIHALIWSTLVSLPQNPFYQANSAVLGPLIATSIMKWHGANQVESEKKPGPVAFAWRAGFYDVVLMVVALVHGHQVAAENANKVIELYGEDYAEYLKEFQNA